MSRNESKEKKEVFISYKAEDYESAHWVKKTLELNGLSCWMAPDCIPGGSNYAVEIPSAIENCSVLVVVLTKNAQMSKWVPREIGEAINKNKVVMPFMLEEYDLSSEYNFYLSNVQRYYAYINKSEAIERMIKEIRAVIGIRKGDDTVIIPEGDYIQPDKAAAKKGKKTKALLISLICIAAAAAIGLAAFFSVKAANAKFESSCYWFNIYAADSVSVTDFNKAQELLEKRLDVLCKNKKYSLKIKNNNFVLGVPKSVFGSYNPQSVIKRYITTTGEIGVVIANKDYSDVKLSEIKRKEVVDVKQQSGEIEDADIKGLETGKTYSYVQLTLSDEYVKSDLSSGEAYEADFLLCDEDSFTVDLKTVPFLETDDKTTFSVVDTEFDGYFADSFYEILCEEETVCELYILADMNFLADWETAKTTEKLGANQTNENKVSNTPVLFKYSLVEERSSGELFDVEAELKNRLDAMNTPYAIGRIYNEDKLESFLIKTDVSRVNKDIMKLLICSSQLYLISDLNELNIFRSDFTNIELTDNALKLTIADYSDIEQFLKDVNSSQTLYLGIKETPLLYCKYDGSGVLSFTHYAYENADGRYSINSDSKWLANVIKTVLDDYTDLTPLRFEDNAFQTGTYAVKGTTSADDFAFYNKDVVDELSAAIKKEYENARVSLNSRELTVLLNLPVNASFAEAAPKAGQWVYELCDFPNSQYSKISIILINEDDNERARIFFNKYYKEYYPSLDEHELGYIFTHGNFTGGKVDLAKDEIINNINNSKFYQDLTDEQLTKWEVELS